MKTFLPSISPTLDKLPLLFDDEDHYSFCCPQLHSSLSPLGWIPKACLDWDCSRIRSPRPCPPSPWFLTIKTIIPRLAGELRGGACALAHVRLWVQSSVPRRRHRIMLSTFFQHACLLPCFLNTVF